MCTHTHTHPLLELALLSLPALSGTNFLMPCSTSPRRDFVSLRRSSRRPRKSVVSVIVAARVDIAFTAALIYHGENVCEHFLT